MSLIQGTRRQNKRDRLIERDGLLCHWCREPFSFQHPMTFEHLIPLANGGTNDDDNLVLACAPCNHARGNRVICAGCGYRIRSWGTAIWTGRVDPWHGQCAPRSDVSDEPVTPLPTLQAL